MINASGHGLVVSVSNIMDIIGLKLNKVMQQFLGRYQKHIFSSSLMYLLESE